MNATLVTILTFAAAFLTVFGANSLLVDVFQSDRKRIRQRMESETRRRQRDRVRESPLFKDLNQIAIEAFEEKEPTLKPWDRFKFLLEQSGLNIAPERVLMLMGASSLMLGLLVAIPLRSVTSGLAAALVGAPIPLLYVAMVRSSRLEKLRAQLPDVFDLMGRVMRAGQTISQAMQAVADEFERPASEEFGYCYEQQNLGLPAEAALRDLSRRTGVLEVKIFVLAVMVHRQTGGNLAELLDKIAAVVRDRYRIRGVIKTFTASGRFQAAILLALPPVVFLAILFLNAEYALSLFDHPELVTGTIVSEIIGALWIRKIINFDF